MVVPISKEILARRTTPKEPNKNFLTGVSASRRELQEVLKRHRDANQVFYREGDFSGLEYNISQEAAKISIRVFCGVKDIGEPESDVMLRVSIRPIFPEGVGARMLGSQEYILQNDNTIVVKEDDRGGRLIDGTKLVDLTTLIEVQILADEVQGKLEALYLKHDPVQADKAGQKAKEI